MGSLQATEMAQSGLSLEDSLRWHLQANHYPPVPEEMIPVCVEAIELYNEGLYRDEVELPHGVTYRNQTSAPAWSIVDAHHLSAWITIEEEY